MNFSGPLLVLSLESTSVHAALLLSLYYRPLLGGLGQYSRLVYLDYIHCATAAGYMADKPTYGSQQFSSFNANRFIHTSS